MPDCWTARPEKLAPMPSRMQPSVSALVFPMWMRTSVKSFTPSSSRDPG